MPSVEGSRRGPARLILLASLAGVLGASVAGCSGGGGPSVPSQKDSKKAAFKRRFQDYGEEKPVKGRR